MTDSNRPGGDESDPTLANTDPAPSDECHICGRRRDDLDDDETLHRWIEPMLGAARWECTPCHGPGPAAGTDDAEAGDRTTPAERERLAALADEDPDALDVEPRGRVPVTAAYAADGVADCRCGLDADAAPDQFVDKAVDAADEWLTRHDPLDRDTFDTLRCRFARGPGEAAVVGDGEDDGPRPVHLRQVSAQALGEWAAAADVALVDLDDDVRFADLHGVPVEGGIVPLVVGAEGLFGEVARDFHAHYHALPRVRDRLGGEGNVLTDGGPDDAGETDSEPDTNAAAVDGARTRLAAMSGPARRGRRAAFGVPRITFPSGTIFIKAARAGGRTTHPRLDGRERSAGRTGTPAFDTRFSSRYPLSRVASPRRTEARATTSKRVSQQTDGRGGIGR